MNGKEIIDLTASEDHEVIVLESGDEAAEGPSKKRARRTPTASSSNGDMRSRQSSGKTDTTNGGAEAGAEGGKKRKVRRGGKGKAVGAEQKGGDEDKDGDVIELRTEESVQTTREGSNERIAEGSSKVVAEGSGKAKAKDQVIRSLLDRLADAETVESEEKDSNSKPSKRKKNKKRKRRDNDTDRERTQTGQDFAIVTGQEDIPDSSLFFVDEAPSEIPSAAKPSTSASVPAPSNKSETTTEEDKPSLLLPPHVSVFEHQGDAPIQIIPPAPLDSDDEDYIQYLDYDDDRRAGVVRYFDDPAELAEAKASQAKRTVCKNCGAEGEHKTWECPVIICLTCGARDEHTTRSCPISKTCYTCGMKGHINRECPNRYTARGRSDAYDDCDRCGSSLHATRECPTVWRIYEYVDDAERLQILSSREEKRDLEIGEGGEAYIAAEAWCYNCGGCGHLGDDCKEVEHHWDTPKEPSAFSSYNVNIGPFADAAQPDQRKPSRAATYAAKMNDAWGDGYGHVIPLDVGKQGKRKEKARLEKRMQETQEDDGDDWFAKRGGGGGGGRDSKGGRSGGGTPKGPKNGRANTKITFGDFGRDDSRYGGRDRDRERDRDRRDSRRDDRKERSYHDDLPGPSRETDSIQIRGASKRNRERRDDDDWGGSIRGAASREHNSNGRDALYDQRRKERSRQDDRYGDRDRRRERDGRGSSPRREPRYRGGYSR